MSLESAPKEESLIKKPYIIGGVILVIALVSSVYFYVQYQQAQVRLANPTLFAQEQAKVVVDAVGRLMTLPTNETPTVATVQDKTKLANQPFFVNAQNGDKVLIYTGAKKAILYRPSINKIIDVAPVNIGPAATGSATAAAAPTPAPLKFVLRNGTNIVGLTKKFEPTLKSKVANAVVSDTDNAANKDYQKSFLVDLTGTMGSEATQMAGALGLTVSPLPSDESTPSADFLIILGADKK